MNNFLLAIIPVLIWGTTWYAIKFQVGVVDPLWSVAFRFFLASFILFGFCWYKKVSWRMPQQGFAFLLGAGLFGLNYWCTYLSETMVISALTAVMYSTMVFMNLFNAAWLLRTRITVAAVCGALLGMFGVTLLYWPELSVGKTTLTTGIMGGGLALGGAYLASLGNIIAKKMSEQKIEVIQMNAWGMLYGAGIDLVLALVLGRPIQFVCSPAYIFSLLYLAVFGSVVAFTAYLTLSKNLGPEKAVYVTLFIPVIALIISGWAEGYLISLYSIVGVALLVLGNYLALQRKSVSR